MSVNLNRSGVARPETSRAIEEIAAEHRIDERIPRLVPGFDAPFFQAGLAGFSDGAMRLLARHHGAPFCVTEALLDRTLISGARGRRREDPDYLEKNAEDELEDLSRHDHPIAGQVMGTLPHEMAQGAKILADMNYDVVDVNFACPVKKIKKACRGGHFLAAPKDAVEVLRQVRAAVPAEIPTTVKLRRSYDDTPEMVAAFETIFDAAYELGYAWTTVHCRTVEQKYKGPSRWSFLTDLVRTNPDRLIFGSGDIWEASDIFAMIELTGVQAVSVARGCIGDPWLFTNARRLMDGKPTSEPSLSEQRQVLSDHLEFAIELHGEWMASRFMRKFASKFSLKHPDSKAVKADFVECDTPDAWRAAIERHYSG